MSKGSALSTSITAIFKTPQEEAPDSEKLKELFQNRAELKKEFAALREENHRLQQYLKEKDGAIARVQQRIQHLENLLYDPDWVHNVVVYFQLKALGRRCESQLARFAEQLKQQREQRLHDEVVEAWAGEQRAEAETLRRRIGEHRMQLQMLEDQLQAERHRVSTMGGLSRILRKRSLAERLEQIEEQIAAAQATEQQLLDELAEIESRDAPDSGGLDIASKRSINFMILSFAQQMYLHFTEDDLAGMAKEAGDKSVGAINYGNKNDCDRILELVARRGKSMENLADFADILQHRARLISDKALFKNDDDAVPVPGTVATVYRIDPNGVVKEKDANLLGENYWNVSAVLSR